jgi:hypothetical protein
MLSSTHIRRLSAALVLSAFASGALAQAAAESSTSQPTKPSAYEPSVGQEGKDVVWVPTPQALVDKMLDMAKVRPTDFLIDLGSGDGRTVITAAKRGVRAMGIEYNPQMVELSKINAQKEGVAGKATFEKADLFASDFSKASVITMFLLDRINLQLRPKLYDLKPGTRLVSNTFTMGDWAEDEKATVSDGCTSFCSAYLWIVPAKVAGTWKLPSGELTLKQTFQMLSGELKLADKTVPVTGRVRGDRIEFTADGVAYAGRVTGEKITGFAKGAAGWTGARIRKAAPSPA